MKITTDYCKKEIIKYVKDKEVFIRKKLIDLTDEQFQEMLSSNKWKRISKIKLDDSNIRRSFISTTIENFYFKDALVVSCYSDLSDSFINSIEITFAGDNNHPKTNKSHNAKDKYGYLITTDPDLLFGLESGYIIFSLVNNKTGYIEDDHTTKHLPLSVQNEVGEIMESTYEFKGTPEELKILLESNGIFPATKISF